MLRFKGNFSLGVYGALRQGSLLLLLLCGWTTGQAQVHVLMELSRKSVYVQQPFRVTITVYTHTWFTAPLAFGNLQIPNAFIVPFDTSQPGMFTIGGKQYPGVQFYYIVFPYKAGNFSIPSLEITAQSPPEGSAQGQKVVLHTAEHPLEVKDVPERMKEQGDWFVAKGLSMKEQWSPKLEELKVGDVLRRIIIIEAQGTLPQFIPDLTGREAVDWAGTYPQVPVLSDTRNEGDVNGKSVQVVTYLLEKSGDFILPALALTYWNPFSGTSNTSSLEQQKIKVSENPDLGILTTLKDSLSATTLPIKGVSGEKKVLLILGMHWYVFAGLSVLVIFAVYVLYVLGKKAYKSLRAFRRRYTQSEPYLFKRFMHAKEEPKSALPALYAWWDSLKQKPSASIGASLGRFADKEGENGFKEYLQGAYYGKKTGNMQLFRKWMKSLRQKIVT